MVLLAVLSGSCALVREAFDLPDPAEKRESGPEEVRDEAGNRVWDPYKQRWVTREEADPTLETVDTVAWREDPVSGQPIGDPDRRDPFAPGVRPGQAPGEAEDGLPVGSARRVALLLPFLGNTFDPEVPMLNPNSSWALHFYGGARLALDSLADIGVHLEVSVFDTEASTTTLGNLIAAQPAVAQSDLLIGPYRRDNARLLAPFAKQWQTPLVSPYTAADNIVADNEYYLQVNPSLSTHLSLLTRHALDFARPDQIVLVSRNEPAERQRLAACQKAYFEKQGTRNVPALEEFFVTDASADLKDLSLKPIIRRGGTTVIMMPIADETFVYSFLRKLELARGPQDRIRVYGLPQWMTFSYVDPEYLTNLDVHISSSFYIDAEAPDVQRFQRAFLRRYGEVPREEAYVGFDIMLYFGRMVYAYGEDMAFEITGRPEKALHTEFRIEPVITPTTTGAEGLPVEQYENRFLHILRFEDIGFIPAR